jgi:hypothetical protein
MLRKSILSLSRKMDEMFVSMGPVLQPLVAMDQRLSRHVADIVDGARSRLSERRKAARARHP